MLGRRRRRRANINPTLSQRLVFAGLHATPPPPHHLRVHCLARWQVTHLHATRCLIIQHHSLYTTWPFTCLHITYKSDSCPFLELNN